MSFILQIIGLILAFYLIIFGLLFILANIHTVILLVLGGMFGRILYLFFLVGYYEIIR